MYTPDRSPISEREVVEFDCRVAMFDAVDQYVETRAPVTVFVPQTALAYCERYFQQVAAGLTSRVIAAELRERHALPPCFMLDVAALLRSVTFEGVSA